MSVSLSMPRFDIVSKALPAGLMLTFAIAAHFLIWLIGSLYFVENLHYDTLELVYWGRDWMLGYGKHPPLATWIVDIAVRSGPIPLALRPLMGNRIYGCDDCLAVCPWNRFAHAAHPKLQARDDLRAPALAELAALDDAGFRAKFAGGPVKRIGRDRFARNVLTAIGNSDDPALLPAAQRLQTDANPVVAEAADWAVMRLQGGGTP